MTDDELDRLQALADKVTTGPWGTIPPGGPNGPFWGICNRLGMIVAMRLTDREADAAFIAASRDAIPALIAEVRRLQEENTMLQCAWLLHETIQPDGELAATLTDVVRENERLRDVLDQIANAGQWSPYHGRDLAAWMATTARVALGEQGYAK